MIHLFISIQP